MLEDHIKLAIFFLENERSCYVHKRNARIVEIIVVLAGNFPLSFLKIMAS
jgi:hypothetical protein